MKYTGTVVKEPIVTENKITTAIKVDNAEKPTQVVTFPKYRDAETIANMSAFKINDAVVLYGKLEPNPKTKEMQIIVNKAYFVNETNNAKNAPKKYFTADEVNPETDFIVGGLSTGGNIISLSEPREGRKQYYTDGNWYWYEGNKYKTPTTF